MFSQLPLLLLRCLLLTALIECAVAFLLRLRRPHDLLTVALVNALTNPPLVCISFVVQFFCGHGLYCATVLLLELAAFLTEALFYRSLLGSKPNPFLLSLILNAASWSLGVLLNSFVF